MTPDEDVITDVLAYPTPVLDRSTVTEYRSGAPITLNGRDYKLSRIKVTRTWTPEDAEQEDPEVLVDVVGYGRPLTARGRVDQRGSTIPLHLPAALADRLTTRDH